MENDLIPIYDTHVSFYGKATTRTKDNKLILRSYATDVAYIEGDLLFIEGWYSATTARHIREFALQNGFKAPAKKEIEINRSNGHTRRE